MLCPHAVRLVATHAGHRPSVWRSIRRPPSLQQVVRLRWRRAPTVPTASRLGQCRFLAQLQFAPIARGPAGVPPCRRPRSSPVRQTSPVLRAEGRGARPRLRGSLGLPAAAGAYPAGSGRRVGVAVRRPHGRVHRTRMRRQYRLSKSGHARRRWNQVVESGQLGQVVFGLGAGVLNKVSADNKGRVTVGGTHGRHRGRMIDCQF